MNTGENEQALRAIFDFIRKGAVITLAIHFYIFCYAAFFEWHLTQQHFEAIVLQVAKLPVFSNVHICKGFILLLLTLSFIGTKGKKEEKISKSGVISAICFGLVLYFGSSLLMYLVMPVDQLAIIYMATTAVGFFSYLTGGARLSRLIKVGLRKDIFNRENESFPQDELLRNNKYSVNLPAIYHYKGKVRKSYINVVNPFRGLLVTGSPGAGKSWYVVNELISQTISKGYTMLCYDYKFDDLSVIVYNSLLKNQHAYKKVPKFCVINFDDLTKTHRCNPLDPTMMEDITDAAEASRSLLIGLNKIWATKTGDFFVESAINFVTAIIWFLKKYEDGKYCTLPHAIELLSTPYMDLFPVLGSEFTLQNYLSPFLQAFLARANEQLEGQIASAKIGLARLSSPQLYYVLSGDDFTLDINNPEDPKVLCCGNNPLKIQIYGAVLSLYTNRLLKLVNRKGQLPCALIFDEYPSIYTPLDSTIATGRSNRIFAAVAVQSIEQVRRDYGKEQADVLVNICGNLIAGQGFGDTAKLVSERIGKIVQERDSVSINRTDTSYSRNSQLDYAVPASRIANFTAGEFAGLVADNPDEAIDKKSFHCFIQNDPVALKAAADAYVPLPQIRELAPDEVMNNYLQIKEDVARIVFNTIERVKSDPDLAHLIIEDQQ